VGSTINLKPCAALFFVFLCGGTSFGATVNPEPTLPVTSRGQSITVFGDGFSGPIKVYLRSGKEAKGAETYRTNSHLLYVVNQDGQAACESFPLNPLTIDSVPQLESGNAQVEVSLVGENFVAGLKGGTWVDAENTEHTIPAADITFVDGNHLKVKIIPGPPGTGRLVLETPASLLASQRITIVRGN